MAILSHADYLHRWTAPAPVGFGQTICPPCYHEYLQREIYFNDYLDLFRNLRTFVRRFHDGRFYVAITGCPILGILGIPEHDIYTINIDGILYLLVDYDYPWPEEKLMKKRCIKYVMIAEAAPPQNPIIPTSRNLNKLNSYFYNHQHTKATQYFSAPCTAFNILTGHKIDKLIKLANNGVLLFDLFPFAINYNGFREFLNEYEISLNFLNGDYPNSITNRIDYIVQENLFCYDFIMNINAVFIAPPTISNYFGELINDDLIIPNLIFRLGLNTFSPPHTNRTSLFYDLIPVHTLLIGVAGGYPMIGLTKSPIYTCCAYNGRGDGAHATFIKNSLGLR
jgi:hypothetical protein